MEVVVSLHARWPANKRRASRGTMSMRRYFSSNCFVQYLLSQNAWQCHMFLHMCMHVHVYVCMCVFVFVCIYVYVHTCMSPCVCVCVCACQRCLILVSRACISSHPMYVCVYVCMHLFIYCMDIHSEIWIVVHMCTYEITWAHARAPVHNIIICTCKRANAAHIHKYACWNVHM
jgi:hypothetical protein